MDKKGILVYLFVTYALAFAGVPLLLHLGLLVYEEPHLLNNLVFLLVMWIPAFGAFVATKTAPNTTCIPRPIRPVPRRPALRIALVVLLIYAIIYGITAMMGWASIQWDMGAMRSQIDSMLQQPLTPSVSAIVPAILIVGGLLLSGILGLTVFAALALGSEWGWRGYLLPRLMPLGRVQAYVLTGLLWAAWFLPLIYGWHREIHQVGRMWLPVLQYLGLGIALSAFLGEIWRRTGNLGLAAVGLGSFCAHLQGIWDHLFQLQVAPWAGSFGVVAMLVWAMVALLPALVSSPAKPAATPGNDA